MPVVGVGMKVTGAGAGVGVVFGESCRVSKRKFSVSARMASSGEHSDETYEEFTIRWVILSFLSLMLQLYAMA